MITLRKFTEFLLPKVLSIDPLTALGIGTAASGALSFLGAKEAGEDARAGADAAAAAQKEMFDISRSDMMPFLEAATGKVTKTAEDLYLEQNPDVAAEIKRGDTDYGGTAQGHFDKYGKREGRAWPDEAREGGALSDYQAGIEQAPGAPQILDAPMFQRFDPRFAERGDRFQGDRFTYDPNEAMDSPDIKFIQEQGEKALMRNLAGRRQLGSGARMTEATKFGQGLASQALSDYFDRKRVMSQMNYGRDIGENQMAYQRGLTERDIDLQDEERERQRILGNRDRSQRVLLDRYALDKDSYEDRMSKLGNLINVGRGAGATTSGGALSTGGNLANIYQGLGRDQASTTMGKFNAIGNTLGDAAMLYGMNRSGYFNEPSPSAPYYIAR
jgi:hypothetical protein